MVGTRFDVLAQKALMELDPSRGTVAAAKGAALYFQVGSLIAVCCNKFPTGIIRPQQIYHIHLATARCPLSKCQTSWPRARCSSAMA